MLLEWKAVSSRPLLWRSFLYIMLSSNHASLATLGTPIHGLFKSISLLDGETVLYPNTGMR
jgi:hypothetical protein